MNKVTGRIKIECRSDLACGSGTGFSNIVDNDIVFDSYGFPYIPARRIRGLLKEAANEYGQFDSSKVDLEEQLFGDETSHLFVLHNAEIEKLKEIHEELDRMNKEDKKYVSPISVLKHYTSIRHQTSIDDNGIAKENSLRSTRVVNRGVEFYAPVEYLEEDKKDLEDILAFVRHMGLRRTRGFGEVRLTLEAGQKENKNVFDAVSKLDDDKEYELKLQVVNRSQLTITGSNGEAILDYIPGTNVLGYFANQYVKRKEPDQDKFNELFLSGKIQFKNGYVSDEQWNEYFPIPASIFKEKTAEKYYDKALEKEPEHVIISRVRNKYMNKNNIIKDVELEWVYHHRRPEDKSIGHVIENNEGTGMFYQTETVAANQRFILPIQGKGKDLKEVLVNDSNFLQIGRSKFTQYGNVEVENIKGLEPLISKNDIQDGTKVIVRLLSPVLLIDEKCVSQTHINALADELGIKLDACFVDYTRIGGYNAKWKLQKPSYIGFAAGTVLTGTLKKDSKPKQVIGELTHEGLGQVEFVEFITECDNKKIIKKYSQHKNTNSTEKPILTRDVWLQSKKEYAHILFVQKVYEEKSAQGLNNTSIGKVLTILSNSKNSMKALDKDVDDIKDEDKKKKIQEAIKNCKKWIDEILKSLNLENDLDDQKKEEFKIRCMKTYFVKLKMEGRSN